MLAALGAGALVLSLLLALGAVAAAVDAGGAVDAFGRFCDVLARPVTSPLGLADDDATDQDRLLGRASAAAVLLAVALILPVVAGRMRDRDEPA